MRAILDHAMSACIPIVAVIMTARIWGWWEAIKVWGTIVGIIGWLCLAAWLLYSAN